MLRLKATGYESPREAVSFGLAAVGGMIVCCGLTSLVLTGGIAAVGGLLVGPPALLVVALAAAGIAARQVLTRRRRACCGADSNAEVTTDSKMRA